MDFVSGRSNGRPITGEVAMIIPDYLIIDEIRRREEKSWEPETLQLPLPRYDIPDDDMEYPTRQSHVDSNRKKPKKVNGAIIIDL